MDYIIIGNGISAIQASEAIRKLDLSASITLISDEECIPYSRPMISMLIDGTLSFKKIKIRKNDYYEKLKIKTVFGKRVTSLDVDKKRLYVANNKIFSYDKLLIASGSDPRLINVPGVKLANIFYLRTAYHANQILSKLSETKHALVSGGGLVGIKAAYGLLSKGIKVTMLIKSDYPLSMQVDKTAGEIILKELIDNGIDVKVQSEVKYFEGDKKVQQACLSDGSKIDCDLVVVGKGVKPSISFLPKDRIKTDYGILVDNHMQTNITDIYAAGDVAECFDIARNKRWINAIWPEAVEQGRVAGINMSGTSLVYKGSLSRNVIKISNLDILSIGDVNPSDKNNYNVISQYNLKENYYRKLIFYNNILKGVVMVNSIEQGGIFYHLIYNEIPVNIPIEYLLKKQFNYGQIMMQQ